MAIFNKCHALFFGFLVFAILGAAGYSINQGDYFQHQYTFIIIKSLLLFLSFGYARWFDMISFGILSKKQLLLFIGVFLLSLLETLVYIKFFAVSSGAGVQHLEEVSRGIYLPLILTLSWILENI